MTSIDRQERRRLLKSTDESGVDDEDCLAEGVLSPGVLTGLLMALLIALLLGWCWQQGAAHRALLRLPPTERAVVYGREFANYRTLCTGASRTASLEDQCRTKAEFLLAFPECDEGCRAVTRADISHPAR